MQFWSLYHRKNTAVLESLQKRFIKMLPGFGDLENRLCTPSLFFLKWWRLSNDLKAKGKEQDTIIMQANIFRQKKLALLLTKRMNENKFARDAIVNKKCFAMTYKNTLWKPIKWIPMTVLLNEKKHFSWLFTLHLKTKLMFQGHKFEGNKQALKRWKIPRLYGFYTRILKEGN